MEKKWHVAPLAAALAPRALVALLLVLLVLAAWLGVLPPEDAARFCGSLLSSPLSSPSSAP